MKKIFNTKQKVEFTKEQLEIAQQVIAAMSNKNVEVAVLAKSAEPVKRKREKNYTKQLSVATSDEMYSKIAAIASKSEKSVATVIRDAFDFYLDNYAA